MLPLDGYVRVSRVGDRSGESFISPNVQERAIRDWAKRNGREVVMQAPELNVSGAAETRPVFDSIMERIESGQSGGFVVYKLDRFSRSLLGALKVLERLGKHGAVFASATEPQLDYVSPSGRAFVQQLFVFSEFTRSTLKESWATTQRHAIERGVHISPNGYLGFDKSDGGRLVPNEQAPVAVELFRRRGAGETWSAMAAWLNDAAPKSNGTQWTDTSVKRLCAKRVYRGEASRYVEQDVDGRGPIVNPNAHPALVTEQEWQAAQMNPRLPGGQSGPLPLLSGLVRCAGCRYSLSIGYGPKGERLYRCRKKHASGTCSDNASVMAEVIEQHVEDLVLTEIDGVTRLVPDSREREGVLEELAQARRDLDAFKRDTAARRKLGAEWHEWLDGYLVAVRAGEAKLAQLDARIGIVSEGVTRDHYLALPVEDRREVLGGFVDTVFVRRSRGRGRNVDPIERRTHVCWRGQAPADLPRRRVVNPIVPFEFEDGVAAGVASAQDGA